MRFERVFRPGIFRVIQPSFSLASYATLTAFPDRSEEQDVVKVSTIRPSTQKAETILI
jgi:hypothetical protein